MKKLNLLIIGMLLSCTLEISASFKKTSENPDDYLEGHYIYPRHLIICYREREDKILDQGVHYPRARQKLSPLNKKNPDSFYWHNNAKNLKPHHFPAVSQGHIDRCWSSELNNNIQEEYKRAQYRDVELAKQYLQELQELQFIKRLTTLRNNSKKKYPCPGLHERPQVNPCGPIGPMTPMTPKSNSSLKSPTAIANYYRLNLSHSQDNNN